MVLLAIAIVPRKAIAVSILLLMSDFYQVFFTFTGVSA